MAEVVKRDKQARNLSVLYQVIKKNRAQCSYAIFNVWAKQLAENWDSFKVCHERVVDRAGATEMDEQHRIYDDAATVHFQASVLIEELREGFAANQRQDAAGAMEDAPRQQMRIRHEVATNRLYAACDRIVETIGAMNAGELDMERKSLEQMRVMLQGFVMDRIAAGEEQDALLAAEAEAEERYRAVLRQIIEAQTLLNAGNGIGDAAGGADLLRMPQLQINPFDGQFDKWEAFRDSFQHGIHLRAHMANVQKLQYLKSVVRGEAEELIQNFALTNDNYVAAWQLLNDRYDNHYELVTCHLRILTTLPVCNVSADDLRRLTNKTASSLLALRNLGRPVEQWNDWIVFHVCEKLDKESRRMWRQQLGVANAVPTWEQLDAFLQGRIRALSCVGEPTSQSASRAPHNKPTKLRTNAVTTTHGQQSQQQIVQKTPAHHVCPCCNEGHAIRFCSAFRSLQSSERRRFVTEKALCYICLSAGHRAAACKSTNACGTCGSKHHTLLHVAAEIEASAPQQVQTYSTAVDGAMSPSRVPVHLAKAIVQVRDNAGVLHQMRAFLDQGSETSIVSEKAALALQLPRYRDPTHLEGLGGAKLGESKQSVVMNVCDNLGRGYSFTMCALVMPRVNTRICPTDDDVVQDWPHMRDLVMADPEYMHRREADVLIGADVYGTLLRPGLRQRKDAPTAQNTVLGWIVSGVSKSTAAQQEQPRLVVVHHAAIDNQLAKFWEIEEPATARRLTAEEQQCEEYFAETVSRDSSGRIHVRLPMQHSNVSFGESQRFAVQRQLQLERRFKANPDFAAKYGAFMEQYEQLGHMHRVDDATADVSRTNAAQTAPREYYIPHHAVIKEASTSTKLRVVFDASRRTTNGTSLNEQMLIGPRLQDDLTTTMMRWRLHRFAFCSDIEKMYRQIIVDAPDDDLQRIVWRRSAGEQLKVYRLSTVTYGTASAPYLAVKALQTLASWEREAHPIGADIVLENFYVDDVLSGAETVQQCIDAKADLVALLASGGFTLRKWASNSEDVLNTVDPADRECQLPLQISSDGDNISTLGVYWFPASDQISVKADMPSAVSVWTKRTFLSAASKLYDPMGWMAPTIIMVKILFQSLWLLELQWDDRLPDTIAQQWAEILNTMAMLREIRIPRWIGTTSSSHVEIHGFCDASMKAFAAVVYVRVSPSDHHPTRIMNVCAKTRVAPIKVLSLPRLELCAAALLTKVIGNVISALRLPNVNITCWTDSTIVLNWLRGHPSRFNVFVANRTAEIQRTVPVEHWRHVVSADNPADCASRGILPEQLVNHHLWWSGPEWLTRPQNEWPQQPTILETTEEARLVVNAAAVCPETWDLINRYSSWRKLVRVTAWCKRFIDNARRRREDRIGSVLQPAELLRAREFWVHTAQAEAYPDDVKQLRNQQPLGKRSSLLSLNPSLSTDLILRVGGRLKHATHLTASARNPAIIPRRSALSALLISDAHEQTLHGGASLMLAYLRRAYWIIDGPNEVRRHVQRCTVCFRYRAKPESQQMAHLPEARVLPSRPFQRSALDYSGAIKVRSARGRGQHATKAYVAVFVCMATKAIHIELVSDLSTTGFIAAFERFTARRGHCSDLYSDNATNFVGAAGVFMRNERSLFGEDVLSALTAKHTTWHFSPPLSPHFNGLAESAIRSVKHHIRRVIGELSLTYEELATVLSKIEACLNSRPLCALSSDPNDFDALTPAHFLIGEPTSIIPQRNVHDCQPTALTRWQLTHQLVQRVWKRWSAEYLHSLQQRRKWQTPTDNIRVGDLVLMLEDNLPPASWSLGRVTEAHPGNDGHVRVVTIKAKGATFKRGVVKVARLPIDVDTSTSVAA